MQRIVLSDDYAMELIVLSKTKTGTGFNAVMAKLNIILMKNSKKTVAEDKQVGEVYLKQNG